MKLVKRIPLVVIISLVSCALVAFGVSHFLLPDAPNTSSLEFVIQEEKQIDTLKKLEVFPVRVTANKEWQKIDSLMQINQMQHALMLVDKIYEKARSQNNTRQFIKACLYRIKLKSSIEEDATAKMIHEMESLTKTADFPEKNILHSITADLYWSYYQQNRRHFTNRTATNSPFQSLSRDVGSDEGDIHTWDLQRIVATCMAHYKASLNEPRELKVYNINHYRVILEKHPDSDKYRPTLYDFLAFRAVAFYTYNEANLAQPAARFLIDNKDYFKPSAEFVKVKLASPDNLSFKFHALKILQQILSLHRADANPTALADTDLQRLDLVYDNAILPEKDDLYLAALQELDKRYGGNDPEISTEILFRIAKLYNEQGNKYNTYTNPSVKNKKKDAMDVIERAVALAPESFGAKNCLALKNEMLQPTLNVTTDEAVLPNKPILASVQYQNVPKVYFKIFALNFKDALLEDGPEKDLEDFYAEQTALTTWAVELPDSADYQKHTVEIALPALDEGYYALLASTDEYFSFSSTILCEQRLWATNLSYVRKTNNNEATVLVLHRETGQPVSGVQVLTYSHEYDYDTRRQTVEFADTLTTNTDGIITIKAKEDSRYINFLFTNGEDNYADEHGLYLYRSNDDDRNNYLSTTFFTDRAIYRPGQTVYFKGIVLQSNDRKPEKTTIVKNHKQVVALHTINGEKVSDLKVTTNEFGSFSGSFTIPATGLTGTMSLRSDNEHGYLSFHVEEYKLPIFEVTFASVKGTYRLSDTVMVTGSAKAYADSVVSNANVTYRVVREVRYPYWRWWWNPMPSSPAQEISNGIAVTKDDGTFDISFTAFPDATIAKEDKPVFTYTVYATVSDINGETHEANTQISAGYESLLLSTTLPERMNIDTQDSVEITATNLNNEPQPAKGTLTIWKLSEPSRVLQSRRWTRPDRFLLSRDEFEKMFPHAVYDNDDNPETWEKEAQMCRFSFNTEDTAKYALDSIAGWTAGTYLMEMVAEDMFGEPVTLTQIIKAFATEETSTPANESSWFEVLNPTVQPGDTLKVAIASAFPDVNLIFETIEGENVGKKQTITLNNEQRMIEIPVPEKYRGNFGINLFFVKNNRAYSANQIIQGAYDNKTPGLEFAASRDKLQAGEEEWRATVNDKESDTATVRLPLSMHDDSLDTFVPHAWDFFPCNANHIYFSWETDDAFEFKGSNQLVQNYQKINYGKRLYDRFLQPGSTVWSNAHHRELRAVPRPDKSRANKVKQSQ